MSNEAIVVRDVDAAVAKAKNFINGSVSLGGGEVGGSILQNIDDVMLRSDYRYTTYYNQGRENRGMYKGVLTEEFWWNPPYGHPRDLDFETLKLFENNEWVQICIDGISDGVTSALWDIVPRVDGEEIGDEEKQECDDFFKGVEAECSIEEVISKMLPELICYDSGAVAQVYPVTAYDEFGRLIDGIKPVALNALDGRSILVETHPVGGQRTQYYQYSWMSPISLPTKFELRELIYFQLRPSSRGPYGTSKLEKIKNAVNFLVDSTEGASKMWENALLMGGQIDHPDVTDEDELRRLSAYYREEFQGAVNKGKFAITGGNTKITQFQFSPDHMQWLDGQKWFGKIVMSIFKITPSEVGFTEDLNRATGMQQMSIHKSRAIKPILRVIQNKINRDIMWANWPNMMFKYKDVLDLDDTMKQSQIDQIDVTIGKITINEVRERDGLDKFEDEKFDSPFATAEEPQEDEWGNGDKGGWNPWGDTGESTDDEDDDDFDDKGFEGVNKAANVGAGSGEAGFAHGADVKVVDGSKQRAKKEKKREKIQVKIENAAWDELKDFWGNVEDELRTKLFYDDIGVSKGGKGSGIKGHHTDKEFIDNRRSEVSKLEVDLGNEKYYHLSNEEEVKFDDDFQNEGQEFGSGLYITSRSNLDTWDIMLGGREHAIEVNTKKLNVIKEEDIPSMSVMAKDFKAVGIGADDIQAKQPTGWTMGKKPFTIALKREWAKLMGFSGIITKEGSDKESQLVVLDSSKVSMVKTVDVFDLRTNKSD